MIEHNRLLNYQSVIKTARHKHEPLNASRFAKITERENKCDIPLSCWTPLWANQFLQTWKGVLLSKGVTEIGIYPMLLYELQPKTIIETGSFNGGSALWFADLLDVFGVQGSVYSIDINLSFLDVKARTDSRIHFLEGDCNDIATVLPLEMLSSLPHPWLVVEDAHINSLGILDYLHGNGLQSEDYLIVEDTSPMQREYWASNWEYEEGEGDQKMDVLRGWLMKHQDEYLIDSYYQDMYGYNASKNWNSILKRV